jgi:ketosteroid isomerase-like protein
MTHSTPPTPPPPVTPENTDGDALSIVKAFVEHINAQDVDGLCELMTDDHRFVDPTGAVHIGRERMRQAWRRYFAMFPDYRIAVETWITSSDHVAGFGTTHGAYAPNGMQVTMYAGRLVVVRDGRVLEWRVCADNEPARVAMRQGDMASDH